jgi:hypothetical protein
MDRLSLEDLTMTRKKRVLVLEAYGNDMGFACPR